LPEAGVAGAQKTLRGTTTDAEKKIKERTKNEQ
jgi:hypothetical protein